MSNPELEFFAFTGLVIGPIMAIWPYHLARINEILDAIGRKPAGEVEPADWYVALYRVIGIVLTLLGAGSAALIYA